MGGIKLDFGWWMVGAGGEGERWLGEGSAPLPATARMERNPSERWTGGAQARALGSELVMVGFFLCSAV